MKNSTINYDYFTTDEYYVPDFTSKEFLNIHKLEELLDPNFVDTYLIQNDQTIEQISNELYGTPDYWDLLLLINKRDPIFGMVYNFDVITEVASNFIDNYEKNVYFNAGLPDDHVAYLLEQQIIEDDSKQEALRHLKIIRPGRLVDIMKLIRQGL